MLLVGEEKTRIFQLNEERSLIPCGLIVLNWKINFWDQYQYLSNCPPTPPLTQQQSIDNELGLMLG